MTATCCEGLCKVVGKGSVGESGTSSLHYHQVTGDHEIIMVVRPGESSLCGSTGAVAAVVVNDAVVVQGVISDGSSIQANANPGDHVAALVHTVPLFNGVVCAQLGELQFTLEQCDLA